MPLWTLIIQSRPVPQKVEDISSNKPLGSQKNRSSKVDVGNPPCILCFSLLCACEMHLRGLCLAPFLNEGQRETKAGVFLPHPSLPPSFSDSSGDSLSSTRASSPCPLGDHFLPFFVPSDPGIPNLWELHHFLSVPLLAHISADSSLIKISVAASSE